MTVAAILFAIAALGGVVMALMRLSGRDYPPMALAIVHGLFAAAGLVALIVALVSAAIPTMAKIALILFLGAAIGGFVLFSYHLKKRALPISYVIGHGIVAVIAFVILIAAIMSRGS